MGRKRSQPKPIAHFVREGKECQHGGIVYQGGTEFSPFESLPVELQNLHLPNLERREVEAPTDLTPSEVVDIVTQEMESPTPQPLEEDVLL